MIPKVANQTMNKITINFWKAKYKQFMLHLLQFCIDHHSRLVTVIYLSKNNTLPEEKCNIRANL